MSGLNTWTISVCLAVVAATILEMLTPDNKMGKSVNMVIGVFLVCAIFLPFAGGIRIELPKMDRAEQDRRIAANTLEEEIEQQSLRTMEARVAELTEEKLLEKGYTAKKISVVMDTLSDSRIEISQMDIWMDAEWLTNEGEIREIVENQLGLSAHIRFG